MLDAIEAGLGFYWVTPTAIIIVPRPNFHVDAQNRPHHADRAAVEWVAPDGEKYYFWHGVRVPPHVIEDPSRITLLEIHNADNAEVRRAMIERYGTARYLLDTGAEQVNKDDYGILYRHRMKNDEDIVMVHVLNSTPEPDGLLTRAEAEKTFGKAAVASALTYASGQGIDCSAPRFKTYFIRVPPATKTAHEGVAWTFGKTTKTYHPRVQT